MVSTTSVDPPKGKVDTDPSTDNPLLDQSGLPRFATIEPRHLTPAIESLLEKLESDFASLESRLSKVGEGDDGAESSDSPSYDDVLPEVERIQEPLGYAWGVAGHLNGVKNGDELRNAYEQNQALVVQAMTRVGQSKPLYDALRDIESSWSRSRNDSPSTGVDEFTSSQMRRAVSGSLRSMTLGGVGLGGEEKERFNEMRIRLSELSTKFSNNVMDATKAFGLTVSDATEMEGVPVSARAMWAQAHKMHVMSEAAAAAKGDEEDGTATAASLEDASDATPESGPWRITLDGPSYVAALSHLPSRTMREKVYKASVTRASELSEVQAQNNVPLIYEILKLKAEMSSMLGFKDYAEMSLDQKMAPDVNSVEELSDLILKKSLPAAIRELEEIKDLAMAEGGPEYAEDKLERLMPWDTSFWAERLKERKFDLTEEELRPYFALPAVLDGMFGLVERLFGIEVVPANDSDAEKWNDDVQFFHVNDIKSGERIAGFYLDPYSRPADKRGGAWMDVCLGKSEACKRDVPVAYLTCNGSPPTAGEGDDEGTPSLMTFREVETLFHEFGHGLQHMLTRATVGDVSGINGVEWDAVELPSQFMENWCYDEPTVYGFAKHYETGEPLPLEMFEKLKEQKTYGAGMMACRQLLFGQLDMELHSSSFDAAAGETGDGESIFDVQRRVATKYSPYNLPLEEDRFLCSFGHIFGGGYAAGYYSYKWAEVMSADAFGAFEDVGLDNEEKVKEVGTKFRDTVLSLGGGGEPMEVFRRFRGREPTPDALLRHSGLA